MPPVQYVIDADALIMLFKHVSSELMAAGRLPVVIPELVWDEVAEGSPRAARIAFMTSIAGTNTAWHAGAPENLLSLRMYSGVEVRLGDGERAAIAYAYLHPDSVFVTLDHLALRRGAEHLRSRVLTIFGALDEWVQSGIISAAVLNTFAKKYAATGTGKEHPVPVWLPALT